MTTTMKRKGYIDEPRREFRRRRRSWENDPVPVLSPKKRELVVTRRDKATRETKRWRDVDANKGNAETISGTRLNGICNGLIRATLTRMAVSRKRVRRPVVKRWDQVQYVVINSNEILKVHFVTMRHNEFRPENSKKTVVKFNHCSYKLAKVPKHLQMSVYMPVNVFVECAVLNDFYLSDTHPSTCITQEKDEREIHGCYVERSSKEARRNWKGQSGEARVWAFQT
ncbi:hypothetical protein K0M31_006460, partial [Melipona bicolor]